MSAALAAGTDTPDVMIVDDNPVNLMVMSAMLEVRGITALLAADGAEALALATATQFDLILMDLQMPVLDGLGATSALRRLESQMSRAPTPVVAYSNCSPGMRVLTAHGLNSTLAKPCSDQELEECLIRWCPTYRPRTFAAIDPDACHEGPVPDAPASQRWFRAASAWFGGHRPAPRTF